MANALGLEPLITKLLSHIDVFLTYNPLSEEALDGKKMIAKSFDDNRLRKMFEFQYEEIHGLFNLLEVMASTTAWYSSVETMTDMMLEIIEELCNIRYVSNVEEEKVSVGFDDEEKTLFEELTESKNLQVISIIGTAGLGLHASNN